MDEFLGKFCFIVVSVNNKNFYYLDSKITSITSTHITFEDCTRNNELHTYRLIDIVEIKLSNRGISNGK